MRIVKLKAFTLAEVLITLSILGIIAAVALPNIINRVQDRAQIAGVKRAYTLFLNAFNQMVVTEGSFDTWNWPENNKEDFLYEKLKMYLAHSKYCGSNNGCLSYGHKGGDYGFYFFKTLSGEVGLSGAYAEDGKYRAVLKNGMTYKIYLSYPTGYIGNCTTESFINEHPYFCLRVGEIVVDINGAKGPNTLGHDIFVFTFFRNGDVKPYYGIRGEISPYGSSLCNKNLTGKYSYSKGCAYWIIKNNNMDYKYRDVTNEW